MKYEAPLYIPPEKIAKCVETIKALLKRKKLRRQELQSLIGLLNFAATATTPGTAFLTRSYDLTQGVNNPYHFIRLGSQRKADLPVWLTFLAAFIGVYFFRN